MRVTLDTNVFGPVAQPELYPNAPQREALDLIRQQIEVGKIQAFISEASLTMEGLTHADRIDVFIRAWATKQYPIDLPKLPEQRVEVIGNTLSLGIKVLHVPRIALGSFYDFSTEDWASDDLFQISDRQNRYFSFARDFPNIGSGALKKLGAKLVGTHSLSTQHLRHLEALPSWPSAQEMMWMQGLLAEFDQPKQYPTQKKFIKEIRELIAEWADLDILASHYSYGNDIFCTLDSARGAGSNGILHPNQRSIFASKFQVAILSPEEFVTKLENET